MSKYYAVKDGNEVGIFESWEECKKAIENYKGAKYKSFATLEDATNYMNGVEKSLDLSTPVAYVDGSFDEKTGRYSFGCVLLINGEEQHFKKAFEADDLVSMRNVAGEIKAAGFIIKHCINKKIKKLTIYYDYQGIESWYTGEWKAKLPGTQKYQEFARDAKTKIDVSFVKVKGHSNDKYNDIVDLLAKQALGIR